ncbi:MAG: sigma-70 family RNA polymerase sigma factor, partial [Micromonosporaceae bacterium]
MSDEVERIAALKDPFEALREATGRMAIAQREVTELSRLRKRLIAGLREQGVTFAEIAEKAGLTRGRIHQIRTTGPAAEGAFLGTGVVTIATPLKQEANNARPVVAFEDMAVAARLTDLARSLGLDATTEHVPIGGDIDLNRPGLIVACGPRLSQNVAEVLAHDPAIVFEHDADGVWTLVRRDTGERYRSGIDQDPARPQDIAYLGRLPRPDGQGSLIVFTGIHP